MNTLLLIRLVYAGNILVAGWISITIKQEGLQGIITGEMLFEAILNRQFRFPEYSYLYAMVVEVIIQVVAVAKVWNVLGLPLFRYLVGPNLASKI